MKRLLILLLFPLMMFAQDSTLIGDVDCSGEVNSQDASLILQFVTNVIDSLPCEANMTGLTPDQLQEMIDMMDEQLSINYIAGSGGGCNFKFPDGIYGEPIFFDSGVSGDDNFLVPQGKTLYITNVHTSENLVVSSTNDGWVNEPILKKINYHWAGSGMQTLNNPIIIPEGISVSFDYASGTSHTFNGFLVESNVEPIINVGGFLVPAGKTLYITHIYDDLQVNDKSIMTNSDEFMRLGIPIILGQDNYVDNGLFNGYLVDEDYFADCSGGGGSTTNSIAETGGSGIDLMFPDGLDGELITWSLFNNNYTVPDGKNLYITHALPAGYYFQINNTPIMGSSLPSNLKIPLMAASGDVISYYYSESWGEFTGTPPMFHGILVDANVNPITYKFDDLGTGGEFYIVPIGKKLIIGNILNYNCDTDITINGDIILQGCFNNCITENGAICNSGKQLEIPLIINSQSIIGLPDNTSSFNGYLVDEDYFSSAGSGSNSNASDGTMSVSTFGDTLTLNGESIIVPGISYENTPNSIFGTVTDIDGNVYQTVNILGAEWMMEDLIVTKFSNGDAINQITGTNNWDSDICNNPGYISYDFSNSDYPNLGFKVRYNGYVINDERNVCPEGWHVATQQEYIDVLNLFDSISYGGEYVGGFGWDNAAPFLKKENGYWDTSYTSPYYPLGQANNQSFLGFENYYIASCSNASSSGGVNLSDANRWWTGTQGGNNGGFFYLRISSTYDEIVFWDADFLAAAGCRCVKD